MFVEGFCFVLLTVFGVGVFVLFVFCCIFGGVCWVFGGVCHFFFFCCDCPKQITSNIRILLLEKNIISFFNNFEHRICKTKVKLLK